MVDILHRTAIKDATPAEVYAALTTVDGLAGWWTEKVGGATGVGDVIEFGFDNASIDVEVAELEPG
jgi:uncharacterized protein YndB with AHSA1/START domain